ncbi:hypothetical protein GGR33_003301 [Methylobacterium brachythecii]|uniref:Uncharacterized protein n=1 Tax=Methylobacterium brachythecii TaxID=1176177 RepID=A0A7W6F7T6_9HYPH|nr:hypothetical protein [Methylobacterium brachythecii]
MKPLLPVSVGERKAHDGGHSPEQESGIDLVTISGRRSPRELNHPAQLLSDGVDEGVNSKGCGTPLQAELVLQLLTPVTIAQPSFHAPVREKWERHRCEKSDEVFSEQRPMGPSLCSDHGASDPS